MAFCQKCGNEIHDEAVICTGCGCPTGIKRNKQATAIKKRNYTSLIFTCLTAGGLILDICYCRNVFFSSIYHYSSSPFLSLLTYFLSVPLFSWLSIGFAIHNAFNNKYDKIVDTISVCSASIIMVVSFIIDCQYLY